MNNAQQKDLNEFEELKNEKKALEARLSEINGKIFEETGECTPPGYDAIYKYKFRAEFDVSGKEEAEFIVVAKSKDEAIARLNDKEEFERITLSIDDRCLIENTLQFIGREYEESVESSSEAEKRKKMADYLEYE